MEIATNDIEGENGEGLGNVDTGGKNIRRMNSSLFRELMQHYKEAWSEIDLHNMRLKWCNKKSKTKS